MNTKRNGCCTECGNPYMYCECDGFLEKQWNAMWEHNIDMRPYVEYRTDDEIEYDECMAKPKLTEQELQQRFKDEIETLVDLGLD